MPISCYFRLLVLIYICYIVSFFSFHMFDIRFISFLHCHWMSRILFLRRIRLFETKKHTIGHSSFQSAECIRLEIWPSTLTGFSFIFWYTDFPKHSNIKENPVKFEIFKKNIKENPVKSEIWMLIFIVISKVKFPPPHSGPDRFWPDFLVNFLQRLF